jgi:hypothetical protein
MQVTKQLLKNDSLLKRAFSTANLESIFVLDSKTPKPAVNPQYPRLYGHYLCPFVEKVRLSLSARAVKFQRCEINLRDKT